MMDVGILFVLVMGIACPVMMGLMMWLMFRDMRPHDASDPHGSPAERMATLRKQKHEIEAEMAAREEHETAAS